MLATAMAAVTFPTRTSSPDSRDPWINYKQEREDMFGGHHSRKEKKKKRVVQYEDVRKGVFKLDES